MTVATAAKRSWFEKWQTPAIREALTFYFCVSPWVLGFVLFTAGPGEADSQR